MARDVIKTPKQVGLSATDLQLLADNLEKYLSTLQPRWWQQHIFFGTQIVAFIRDDLNEKEPF